MRSAIFSLLPVRKGSTIASQRLARWLAICLDIPLYDDDKILQEGDLDNLFIVNGSTLYCHHLSAIAKAVAGAENVIWVQNDYTLPPPAPESSAKSPFREAFARRKLVPHYWTTCEENCSKTSKSQWVNWNILGLEPGLPPAHLNDATYIYYGAYRPSRHDSFLKMIRWLRDEKLVVSSTSDRFGKLGIGPFRDDFHRSLAQFGMGVYMQDEKSSNKMHCPATRFYEMLSVGLPMCFMPDTAKTLEVYGLDVYDYILGPDTAYDLIHSRHAVQEHQRRDWYDRHMEINFAQQVRTMYESTLGRRDGVLDNGAVRNQTAPRAGTPEAVVS